MAGPERDLGKEVGKWAVRGGLVAAALGVIGWLANLPLPNKELVVGGGALAAFGVIYERVAGKKK